MADSCQNKSDPVIPDGADEECRDTEGNKYPSNSHKYKLIEESNKGQPGHKKGQGRADIGQECILI